MAPEPFIHGHLQSTRTLRRIFVNTVHVTQASLRVMCRPSAERPFQTANHKENLDKRLSDPFERVQKQRQKQNIALAARENQDHIEQTYTSVKQKVHAEAKRQQVFHIIWDTSLCCDKRQKATA